MTTGVNVYERLQGEVNTLTSENKQLRQWVAEAEARATKGQERFEEAESRAMHWEQYAAKLTAQVGRLSEMLHLIALEHEAQAERIHRAID